MVEKKLILKDFLKNVFEEKDFEIEEFLSFIFDNAPDNVLDFFVEKFSLEERIRLYEKRAIVETYLLSLPKADKKTVKMIVEKMPETALDSLISEYDKRQKEKVETSRNKVLKNLVKKEMEKYGGISPAKKKEIEKKVQKMSEKELEKYMDKIS